MALQLHATLGKRGTTAITATATATATTIAITATVECYANWGVVAAAKFAATSGRLLA